MPLVTLMVKLLLCEGFITRSRAKQRLIYNSGNNDPITGVQFNETEQVLYVTTTEKLLTVATTGRNHEKPLKYYPINMEPI